MSGRVRSAGNGGYRRGVVPRVALVTVLVALVVVLGVLSMHAIDAHPPTGSHHGPASEAANPSHGHGHGNHAAPLTAVHDPQLTASQPLGTPAPVGHGTEGEPAPVAQHLALCAAVILAAASLLRTALAARRVAPFAVRRIVQAAFTPEPPVPRLALVAI